MCADQRPFKRDQEIAMAFIKALAAQHEKRSSENKKLWKKINQMLQRVTVISRSLIPLTPIPGIGLNSESPSLVASRTVWCPFLTSPAKEFKCFARQQEFPSSKCSHVETSTFLLYHFWINVILFLIFVRSHSRTSLPCSFVESNSFFLNELNKFY